MPWLLLVNGAASDDVISVVRATAGFDGDRIGSWLSIRPWPKPPWWAAPTISKGKAIVAPSVTLQDRVSAAMRRDGRSAPSTWAPNRHRLPAPMKNPLQRCLPKTRSGKIMRRILRPLAAGGKRVKAATTSPWEDALRARCLRV